MVRVIFLKKYIAFLLILVTVLTVPFSAAAESGAFLVMDGYTLEVLEHQNGDVRLPMASTTKVMTALVILETVELKQKVIIPKEAAGTEGTSLYVKAGEEYTIEQLLYGLLLQSANDCAEALAWYAGGKNTNAFVAMMNRKAVEIGLKDTHFANASGLPAEEHYTTARELALIMSEAMKNETFRTITATKRCTIKDKSVVNHNRLLSLYPDCIGGKTGYTIEAGRCLVTVAERQGAPLICVTLGRRDDWNIHAAAYEKWFATLETVTLTEKEEFRTELPVAGGGRVFAVNSSAVEARVFQYDETAVPLVLSAPFVYGNKEAGAVVGTVEFWYHDTKIGESPLVLCEPVTVQLKKELFITRIFRFFRRIFLKNK